MDRNKVAQEEQRRKKVDEIMKQQKQVGCGWTGCKRKVMTTMSLPVIEPQPDGTMKKVDQMGVGVPFCDYHLLIAANGLCAATPIPGQKGKFQLFAPMDMVAAAEAVISGMIMSGQMQDLLKGKEESQKKTKEKEKHEDKPKEAEQGKDEKPDKTSHK